MSYKEIISEYYQLYYDDRKIENNMGYKIIINILDMNYNSIIIIERINNYIDDYIRAFSHLKSFYVSTPTKKIHNDYILVTITIEGYELIIKVELDSINKVKNVKLIIPYMNEKIINKIYHSSTDDYMVKFGYIISKNEINKYLSKRKKEILQEVERDALVTVRQFITDFIDENLTKDKLREIMQ